MRVRYIRKALDEWLPTLTRYAGLILLVYAVLVDKGRNPALVPGAFGMILLKTVAGKDRE